MSDKVKQEVKRFLGEGSKSLYGQRVKVGDTFTSRDGVTVRVTAIEVEYGRSGRDSDAFLTYDYQMPNGSGGTETVSANNFWNNIEEK
jgi:hypothetical protein